MSTSMSIPTSTSLRWPMPTTVSVQTHLTIPPQTIASAYVSIESRLSSMEVAILTETDTNLAYTMGARAQELSASLAYYSLLGVQATATDQHVIQTVAAEAAQASYTVDHLVRSHEFFRGNPPSLGGNMALVVVFAILLLAQVIFGVFYGQWWFLSCFFCAVVLEVLGYAGRTWTHYNLRSFNAFVLQLVCITIAPCFHMAGIYYNLAQLTVVMGQHFSILKPMQYSLIFIVADLVSIVIQAVGGAMSAMALGNHESTRNGSNVMVAGITVQVFSMCVFQFLWYTFCWRCYKADKKYGKHVFTPEYASIRKNKRFYHFWVAISVAVILIFIRCIYRLVEMAEGFGGDLANSEVHLMCLEAMMVALATLIMTVYHPGRAYGRHSGIVVDKGIKNSFTPKTEHYKNLEKDMVATSEEEASTSESKDSKDPQKRSEEV